MDSKLVRSLLFGLLLLGFFYYARRYIESTAFVIGGEKYYVLFDDAMISMRYAYNLAHGLGPVWNAGERVEGFTNPLWVGFMALVHLLPIPLLKTSLVIQISGALLMAATLHFVRLIVEHFTDDLLTMLGAATLTAFYQPLHSWSLLGMEVSLLGLILTGAIWLILKNDGRLTSWTLILLAVSTLVRFDMAVPFLVILTVLFIVQREDRKRTVFWGLGLLVLFLGVQTLARYFYYGQWLPNTYYLKVEGWPFALRILRGSYALIRFLYYSNWLLFLLPLGLFFFRRDWKVTLLLAVIAGQLAYSVYVGGDAWEEHGGANRYIAIAMPLFFVAFMWAVEEIRKIAVAQVSTTLRYRSPEERRNFAAQAPGTKEHDVGRASRRMIEVGSRVAVLTLFAFSILNFNALAGDWKSVERWTFNRRPDYVAGNDRNLQLALALQETTRPGASVAVIGAGTIPYLLPDRYAIDILGKADPVIAHGPVRTPMSILDIPGMRPGHMKWNYAHTFGELKPDVIVSIWEGTGDEAAPYLEDYVYAEIGDKLRVYLRRDSPNILWEKVLIPN